ncbi:UBX domain-containing protein 2 [Wickerhamomyces ciferrii]|uniref:UBX domain-containing protein 2 n=1 Tax=Wickerhamomyces ciferrii (strain ATCC 14091 / BCRC 22168 / CBS 111 / JCM 3599 / NBRC 0793 / NRRL Y-1031 F-60-10) TaxID=1206466 RepID=K0KLT3_WICCF|nr:UBX domain-containing protein 2 [Wickerhamomyces ciferrii]CCH42284.1 UBX domain-containing protein 2 [Wickerhamomyces ciferrii]
MDTLTREEEDTVHQFISITNYPGEPYTAIHYLQETDWELERAIIHYFENTPEANETLNTNARRTTQQPVNTEVPEPDTNMDSSTSSFPLNILESLRRRLDNLRLQGSYIPLSNDDHGASSRGFLSLNSKDKLVYVTQLALYIPVLALYKISAIVLYTITTAFPFVKRITDRYSLNRHSSRSEPKGIDPSHIARNFISDFNNFYPNNNKIDFFEGGYTSALYIAKRDARFLLVYLHSEEHDESEKFINQTLLSEDFINFIDQHNILIWGGNVRESESYQVSNALGVTKYPFLGLLALKTSTTETPEGTTTSAPTLNVVAKVQGFVPTDKLVDKLSSQIERLEPTLVTIRAERQQEELARVIREQQDQAYQTSLQRDRQKQEEKRQKRLLAQNKEQWLKWRLSTLKPEVESSKKNEYARIAIRLSNGERLMRRFDKNLPIEEIYAYVELKEKGLLDGLISGGTNISKPEGFVYKFDFNLISPMPRAELSPSLDVLIKDEPVVWPNGNLIVEYNES